MISLSRFLVCLSTACLVAAGPVWAQNGNTDTGGSIPQSDVSGSIGSDLGAYPSDDPQLRLNATTSQLIQSLQAGMLNTGRAGEAPVAVSEGMTALLFVPSPTEVQRAPQQFVDGLTRDGIPVVEARRLSETLTGLFRNNTVQPAQLRDALEAFNGVIDVAPTNVLQNPSDDIVAVRTILTTLVTSAS